MSTATDPPRPIADSARCPCLSGEVYGECCGAYHRGTAQAPTAERLMRSRFSAFAVGDAEYLLATWHPHTRPGELELDPGIRWFRLDIVGRTGGGVLDSEGTVEFSAHYRMRATAAAAPAAAAAAPSLNATPPTSGVQHENSRFTRIDGRWFYVDAV